MAQYLSVKQCQFAEDLESFEISAYPQGQPSGFHTQNDPTQPFQRENIIERKGRVCITCDHEDIIHERYSEENQSPRTLILLRFRFDPNGPARRIKAAHVVVRFAGIKQGQDDPVVVAICPDDNLYIDPKQQSESLVKGGGMSMSGGPAGASIGGDIKYEKTIVCETSDATRLRGSIDRMGRNWGPKNSASWDLWENETRRTGVVSYMQAAVLVKRRNDDKFKAIFTIKISPDTLTTLGYLLMFKSNPEDDDVFYDPTRAAAKKARNYDVNNLEAAPLDSLASVVFQTILSGTVRKERLGDRELCGDT